MGVFGFLAHRSTKKAIAKTIDWYKSSGPDKRAGMLFYLWLSRGINLASVRDDLGAFIPVYYYLRGAEVALLDLIALFDKANNGSMKNAANHHFYTNLAVSYPDQGYGDLVRRLWKAVLHDFTDLEEVVAEMRPVLDSSDSRQAIENNDVSVNKLIEDPSSIMPHFLVPGHPLSAQLLEEEKMGNYIRGQ